MDLKALKKIVKLIPRAYCRLRFAFSGQGGRKHELAVVVIVKNEEPYIREPMEPEPGTMQFTVPEDAYFCMGDNRNESMDARYWHNTFVYRDKIIAKVCFRYWPGFKVIK